MAKNDKDDNRKIVSSVQPTHTGRRHPPKAEGHDYFVAPGRPIKPATGPEGGPLPDRRSDEEE